LFAAFDCLTSRTNHLNELKKPGTVYVVNIAGVIAFK